MNIGTVKSVEITDELSKSYVDYAMSVIVSRALPDIKDGLKPVHRRILYAMHQMGLSHSSGFTKSAKVVGEVLGKYHPHGDMAVYDSLVRMAQTFSLRYPLIKGQGNFGSVDGDSAAAMRYTEVKLAKISRTMLADIEKDTVQFADNFDQTLKEPEYLPAILPNLLLMGAEGIAVGMATKIPPHNLTEVANAIIETIERGKVVTDNKEQEKSTEFVIKKINLIASGEHKKSDDFEEMNAPEVGFESEITVDELVEIIPGPDFPTGAYIYDAESLKDMYATGKGKVLIRGKADIQEAERGKSQIVITEIPYQVNKAQLVAKIAELVGDKKIKGVSDLRDESDKDGMRVVIDLKRDSRPNAVLNNVYKYTKLQTSFPANFVCLVDGSPHTVNLKQILVEYIKHRQRVIVRRTIFDLTAAKKRAHILEGLKIALDNLDAVIKTIRASKTQEDAKNNLIRKFSLTDIQATAILDMQLRRLAALEREKIEKEYEEIKKLIDKLTAILKDPMKVLTIITKEVTQVRDEFGDERLTKIFKQKLGSFSDEDLVPKEETLITLTRTGYIKRVPRGTYKSQRRGGKGVVGMTQKEEDEIEQIVSATTHDDLLFFTDKGKVFGTKAWEIPSTSRQSKGQALVNFLNMEADEHVLSTLALNSNSKIKNLIIATQKGKVKKTKISDFKNMRTSGLIAIRLKKNDRVVAVSSTEGDDHIILVTRNGKSIRFSEKNARAMGRATSGVTGIKLDRDDEVISMNVFAAKQKKPKDKRKSFFRHILVLTENGLGKRVPTRLFPVQKRAGKGVKASTINEKTGKLACATLVTHKISLIVMTSKKGQVIKLPVKNIPKMGRITQGVIMMRFSKKGDHVAAVTALKKIK